jgi:hypothetical protein
VWPWFDFTILDTSIKYGIPAIENVTPCGDAAKLVDSEISWDPSPALPQAGAKNGRAQEDSAG